MTIGVQSPHALNLGELNLAQRLAQAILKLLGWQLKVKLPTTPKYVLIGAPHTSNWDGVFMVLVNYALNLGLNWVGKDNLFKWPIGVLMRGLGGIPVNRREHTNFTQQMVAYFEQRDKLILVLAPEGTRSKTKRWKSGFYYIALGAGVPILMATIDYEHKEIGLEKTLNPSGDLQADFEKIRAHYAPIKGKYPHKQGKITLQEE